MKKEEIKKEEKEPKKVEVKPAPAPITQVASEKKTEKGNGGMFDNFFGANPNK
jgi:hypothetical protein